MFGDVSNNEQQDAPARDQIENGNVW